MTGRPFRPGVHNFWLFITDPPEPAADLPPLDDGWPLLALRDRAREAFRAWLHSRHWSACVFRASLLVALLALFVHALWLLTGSPMALWRWL